MPGNPAGSSARIADAASGLSETAAPGVKRRDKSHATLPAPHIVVALRELCRRIHSRGVAPPLRDLKPIIDLCPRIQPMDFQLFPSIVESESVSWVWLCQQLSLIPPDKASRLHGRHQYAAVHDWNLSSPPGCRSPAA